MAFFLLVVMGGTAGIVGAAADADDAAIAIPVLGIAGTALAMFLGAFALPGLAAGYGLLKFKPWARILGIVLSALNLINIPLGTILGAYGLWVLLSQRHGTAVRRCSGCDVNEPLRRAFVPPTASKHSFCISPEHAGKWCACSRAGHGLAHIHAPVAELRSPHATPPGRALSCSGRTSRFPLEIWTKLARPRMRRRSRAGLSRSARDGTAAGWSRGRTDPLYRFSARRRLHVAADRAEKTRRVPVALAFVLACASVAMIAAASLGWRAVLQPPTPTALKTSLRGDVTLPADPVVDPEPSHPLRRPA